MGPLHPTGSVVAPSGGMRCSPARYGPPAAAAGLRLLPYQHAGTADTHAWANGALSVAHRPAAALGLPVTMCPGEH